MSNLKFDLLYVSNDDILWEWKNMNLNQVPIQNIYLPQSGKLLMCKI